VGRTGFRQRVLVAHIRGKCDGEAAALLSQMMRSLFRIGTPKQAAAGVAKAVMAALGALSLVLQALGWFFQAIQSLTQAIAKSHSSIRHETYWVQYELASFPHP